MREFARPRCAVLPVSDVLYPFVDADGVGVEQRFGLGACLRVEKIFGRLSVSRGKQSAKVCEIVGEEAGDARLENSGKTARREATTDVHLREAVEGVVVAECHRAIFVGGAIGVEHTILVEVDRCVGRPFEVADVAAGATATGRATRAAGGAVAAGAARCHES